jgi:drug/metabolite transporter (DMT)-like permease
MLDEVSSDVVARAQRVRQGFGWGDVLVVAATTIWGVNVVVVKLALTDSGPFTYAAIRYVLGGLALCGLARWLEGPLVRPRGTDAWLIAAAAAAGVLVCQAGFAGALALTNADNIAMISGTTPLLVVGWLVWRNREHFEAKVWGGLGLGLVGLVLVVGAGVATWSSWLVVLVALGNPLGSAVYLLLLSRLLGRYRPLTLAALVTMVGAVMLVPFGAVEALNRHPHVTGPWLGLLAYSALAAVALTAWLYLPGVRRLGPARTTVYSYLQPFLAVVAAGLLIREPILPLQLLGGVIMLVGVVMGRPRRIVGVGASCDHGQRDAVGVDQIRALGALLGPIHRARPGHLPAAGRLGDASVDSHVGEFEADHPVIGSEGARSCPGFPSHVGIIRRSA